jgi:hypothetical protein
MVDGIKAVISNYQERLMNMAFPPKSSFGRAVLGDDGNANKLFLMYIFLDMDVAIRCCRSVQQVPSSRRYNRLEHFDSTHLLRLLMTHSLSSSSSTNHTYGNTYYAPITHPCLRLISILTVGPITCCAGRRIDATSGAVPKIVGRISIIYGMK